MFRSIKLIALIQILVFTFVLFGCTNDNIGSTSGNNRHVTLDVDNGSIKDGAMDASLTPLLVVKFDQKVNPQTMTKNAITMQDNEGNLVDLDGVVSNDNNTSFYASPTSELKPRTTYKVTVSSSVKAEGTNDSMGQTFSLTTGESAIPEVGIINPENNETKVPQNPNIFFKFSSKVNNVNSDNVVVYRDTVGGTIVPLDSIVAGANNTYAVTPKGNLASSQRYYVQFKDGIKNESGISIESRIYTFRMADFAAPNVIALTPSNGETGVSTTPIISIKFHEGAVGMNDENVELHKGSESGEIVPISSIEEGAGAVYTFSPVNPLDENTQYFLVLKPGICDIVGNCIQRRVFNFTTGDFTIPEVSLINPVDNAEKVDLTPEIEVRFSEPVQNVNSTNVELRENSQTGNQVLLNNIIQGDGNTYTFSPSKLKDKTKYVLILKNGIKDLGGHSLEQTVFSFTTGDFTAPEVNLIEPLNNSIGISRAPVISLSFSESVVNVTHDNVKLYAGSESGNPVPLTNIIEENNIYSFTSKSALIAGMKYILVVESGIEDLSGNHLERKVFSFTVGDNVKPEVAMLTKNNLSPNDMSPYFELEFSEPVNNVNKDNVIVTIGSESGAGVNITSIENTSDNKYKVSLSDLAGQTKYYVTLTNGIQDNSGATLDKKTFMLQSGSSIRNTLLLTAGKRFATCLYDNGNMTNCSQALNESLLSQIKKSRVYAAVAFAYKKQYVYILAGDGEISEPAVYKCDVNSSGDLINNCVGQAATSGYDAVSGFISQDMQYLYFANPLGGVVKCSINESDGILTGCNQATGGIVLSTNNQIKSIAYNKLNKGLYVNLSSSIVYKCAIDNTGSIINCNKISTIRYARNDVSYNAFTFSYDGQLLYSYLSNINKPYIERCMLNGNDFINCMETRTIYPNEKKRTFDIKFIDKKVLFTGADVNSDYYDRSRIMMCDINQNTGVNVFGGFTSCNVIEKLISPIWGDPSRISDEYVSIVLLKK